jgi:hypothetical protein
LLRFPDRARVVLDFVVVAMAVAYPATCDLTPVPRLVAAFRRPTAVGRSGARTTAFQEVTVLVLGIILMLIGFLLSVPVLWTIGIILAVIGAVLWVAEGAGATWGRRWY